MANTQSAVLVATAMAEKILEPIAETLDKSVFVEMGANIALGLVEGMTSEDALLKVSKAALKLSMVAAGTTTDFNEIDSPSGLYRGYGDYIAQGLALGMEDGSSYVEKSAITLSEIVRDTMNRVKEITENEDDLTPVISPVLDLTNLKESTRKIGSMFPGQSLSLASSVGIGRVSSTSSLDAQNGAATQQINFTQNNYSPKALSRVEIYRQTKNQISMMKGVTTANA